MQYEDNEVKDLVVTCPHCNEPILIEKLNCRIFRHGVFKADGKQIDPHLNKALCDFYKDHNLIFGCGKPFQIIKSGDQFKTEICDYI
jgi:hypothetical protein